MGIDHASKLFHSVLLLSGAAKRVGFVPQRATSVSSQKNAQFPSSTQRRRTDQPSPNRPPSDRASERQLRHFPKTFQVALHPDFSKNSISRTEPDEITVGQYRTGPPQTKSDWLDRTEPPQTKWHLKSNCPTLSAENCQLTIVKEP